MSHRLAIQQAENIRELGGYKTKEGRQIAMKKVIRSASINKLNQQDQRYLAEYGLRTIVDFRSPEERMAQPDKEVPQAENIFLPILPIEESSEVSAAPQNLIKKLQSGVSGREQMRTVYQGFVTIPYVRAQYRKFFDILLNNEEKNQSVLFHCSVGKDRTGFGSALLLHVLGVDERTIMEDYLATNAYLKPRLDLVLSQEEQQGASAAILHEVEEMLSAREEYLTTSFAKMKEEFGSMEGFITAGIGLTPKNIQELRRIYLA